MPYCGTAKTYPHGVVRLEGAISALTADAAFKDGRYTSPPLKGLAAWSRHWAGWVWSQEWWRRELFKPQWATVDEVRNTCRRVPTRLLDDRHFGVDARALREDEMTAEVPACRDCSESQRSEHGARRVVAS